MSDISIIFVFKRRVKLIRIWFIWIWMACIVPVYAAGTGRIRHSFLSFSGKNKSDPAADSIMQKVIDNAVGYERLVAEYEAEVYIKGYSEVLKSNLLFRFAPSILPIDRKNPRIVYELVSDLKYTAPNHFVHKFEAVNGNVMPNRERRNEILNFLNTNIYAPTAYNDEIILPLAKNAFKLYRFTLEGVQDTTGFKIYKIRFDPRQWSQKLMCGYLYVLDGLWSVDKIDANGRLDFAEFNVVMDFGRAYNHYFLLQRMDVFLRYRVLGNTIISNYTTSFRYKDVEWRKPGDLPKHSYDLSSYYSITSDTIPIVRDTAYWNTKRVEPLTPEEKKTYGLVKEYHPKEDSINYLKITEKLVSTMNFNYRSARVKYSGILNPFKLGYSGSDGITYKQQLRLSKSFADDRAIRFRPEIGFVFRRKEVFYKVNTEFLYAPKRMGYVSLLLANGNQGYSSEVTDQIRDMVRDSSFSFESLDITYYRDYYVDLRNWIEICNGFTLGTGLSYHFRKPAHPIDGSQVGGDVSALVNSTYGDFIPILNLRYTPGQFFRMDGNRKEYVRSKFPTIEFEYARGIPHILGSRGNYERMELDIQQQIPFGSLRKLNYHVGGGFFTRQRSVYFANFAFFARRNFPDSWDDGIGGVFQLLGRDWYNAASSYAQAHVMYESPFVLLQLIKRDIATKYVFSERIYLSQLYLPVLPSYTEIGYGVGNHLFNLGFFVSFEKAHYNSMGVKFAFELFQ